MTSRGEMLRRTALLRSRRLGTLTFSKDFFLCGPIKWPYIYKAQIVISLPQMRISLFF